jgi:hypothetical protein
MERNQNSISTVRRNFLFYLDIGRLGCMADEGFSHEDYANKIQNICKDRKFDIRNLVINHEHRNHDLSQPTKPLCHYQCYVRFWRTTRIDHNIFAVHADNGDYRVWFDFHQVTNHNRAVNYCKKAESRFPGTTPYEFETADRSAADQDPKLVDFFRCLFNNDFQNAKDIMQAALDVGNPYLLGQIVTGLSKFNQFVLPDEVKQNGFGWNQDWVPPAIKRWFDTEFPLPKGTRRRAMVVWGPRGCAKTYFFSNAFMKNPKGPDDPLSNPSIVYFRNEFDVRQYASKPNAILAVCDDMTFHNNQNELLKGLFSGQPTAMSTKYGLGTTTPLSCVYLTNDINHFFHLASSELFEFDCYFHRMEIGQFLCPLADSQRIQMARDRVANFDEHDPVYAEFLNKKRAKQQARQQRNNVNT